jgi:hypothetical protein
MQEDNYRACANIRRGDVRVVRMGEAPNLGNVTIKQRFTDDTDYEMLIVGLKENTTYHYRAIVSNIHGTAEGRVNSFTTAPCE